MWGDAGRFDLVEREEEQPFGRSRRPRAAVGRKAHAGAAHREARHALAAAREAARRGGGGAARLVVVCVEQQVLRRPGVGQVRRVEVHPHAVERGVVGEDVLAQQRALVDAVEADELGVAAREEGATVGREAERAEAL